MHNAMYPPPDPSAIYWRRSREGRPHEVGSIQSIERYDNGSWRALFLIPGQAPFYINQSSPELKDWEPVFALTEDNFEKAVERIAQRVAEILQEKGSDVAETVSKAMEVITQPTIEEAFEVAVGATTLEEDDGEGDTYIASDFKRKKKQYVCGVCDKKYAYEKALKTHMKKAHAPLAG